MNGREIANLTELLREAEAHHAAYEATAPKHHWSGWYAAYVVARLNGLESESAAELASRFIDAALQGEAAHLASP